MSGSIRFDLRELEAVDRRFLRVSRGNRHSLMEMIGFTGENQSRERIQNEKESPEGIPWPAWSDEYAKTRTAGQSLLQGEGDLLDSLTYEVGAGGDYVDIGSNLPYAAIQQFGGTEDMAPGPAAIPAREYLGVSDDNAEEFEAVAVHWMNEQIMGAGL